MSKNFDIFLLWLLNLTNFMFPLWPFILLYLANYQIYFLPHYSYKDYFNLTLFLFAGVPLGTFIAAKLIFLFGIKKTIFIIGILLFCCVSSFYMFSNYFIFIIGSLLIGINYSLINTCTAYFLSEKYENGLQYLGISMTGMNFFSIMFPYFANYIMNPMNKKMTYQVQFGNSEIESFFTYDVAKNFIKLSLILSVFALSVCIFVFLFLEDPPSIKSHFSLYIKALI